VRIRRLGLWLLALSIGIAAAIGAIAVARLSIADRALRWLAASRGIAPLSLRVENVGRRGLEVREVVLGARAAPALAVERLDAAWSLGSLREGRLDDLEVSGARLEGAVDARGLHLGALDPLLQAGDARPHDSAGSAHDSAGKPHDSAGKADDSAGYAARAMLPSRRLVLRDARAHIETPQGPVRLTIAGTLREAPRGRIAGKLTLHVEHPLLLARGSLELDGTPDAMGFRAALDGETSSWGRLDARGRWLGDGTFEARVAVRDVDLAMLLARASVPGLEGSGRIEGDLPLARRGAALEVNGGVVRAAPGGGALRYHPSAATQALADSRPNDLGLALSALSDFRYEKLEAALDGDLAGDMKIAVQLRGANPEFQDGRPVELNLNLEARLADLVRSGLASYRVPEAIEERLRGSAGGRER
jgi:hypothetical protein